LIILDRLSRRFDLSDGCENHFGSAEFLQYPYHFGAFFSSDSFAVFSQPPKVEMAGEPPFSLIGCAAVSAASVSPVLRSDSDSCNARLPSISRAPCWPLPDAVFSGSFYASA
jgi:hypothetical protein